MWSCVAVVKCPLPCVSYGSFEMFKISASDFGTVGMHRCKQACADKFLATVTESVVHSIYKVLTWSSFGVTWQHKGSGGRWTFCHCGTRSHTTLHTTFLRTPTTVNYNACSVNATPNLGNYVAPLEAVLLPWKKCNHWTYRLWYEWGISYLRQGGYVFAWDCLSLCLFVNKITKKLIDRFWWNFQDTSEKVKGRND